MSDEGTRNIVHAALTQRGFERAKFEEGQPLRYDGTLAVCGHEISVALTLPCLDFTIFPKVILTDRAQLPRVSAHIGHDNSICYVPPGSVVMDRYDPAGTVLTVLNRATTTLTSVLDHSADRDIPAEFPQYWSELRISVAIPPDADEGPAQVVTIFRGKEPQLTVLTRAGLGLASFPPVIAKAARANSKPAWLFRVARELDLPPGMTPPDNLDQLRDWAETMVVGLAQKITNVICHPLFLRDVPSIFFMAPTGCVGVGLFLPKLIKQATQRPQFRTNYILANPKSVEFIRWSGHRIDADFIVKRNLGIDVSLARRRIVLIGCGTIGSHLAKFLVQSGAGFDHGRLTLVDPQTLTAANIGRHWLGPEHLERNKAEACSDVLHGMFPTHDIHPEGSSIMERSRLLSSADLVIDATGEEAVSFAINDALVRLRPNSSDALYVWLVGNGAAAQALFVPSKNAFSACRKCLHPVLQDAAQYDPILPGLEIREQPAACGDAAFLPYGVAAPAIAAGLGMRMCLDWARGQPQPMLRTLRVDLGATVAVSDCDPPSSTECPCCGSPEA